MNLAWEFVCSPWAQRWSMMLLHFAWQGCLVAVVVSVIIRMLRADDSDRRYSVTLVGLLSMVVIPAMTFAWTEPEILTATQPNALLEPWVTDAIEFEPQAPLDNLTLQNSAEPTFRWMQLLEESSWSAVAGGTLLHLAGCRADFGQPSRGGGILDVADPQSLVESFCVSSLGKRSTCSEARHQVSADGPGVERRCGRAELWIFSRSRDSARVVADADEA